MALKKANQKLIPVIDLFAGPGGLAEGFASLRIKGKRVFKLALSVEKEKSAHRTLQLRSFFRQFETPPVEYYHYIAGKLSLDALAMAHPGEWAAARNETLCLELGSDEAAKKIDPILKEVRRQSGSETVLLGGPPCQAYSLVGRARNRGVEGYDASKDHRHFLYREYIRIIDELRPAAFVMENVKGILSSKVGIDQIFHLIMRDLRAAGGKDGGYELYGLSAKGPGASSPFIVRCENYGIPQRRHRVVILGIRKDLAPCRQLDNLDEFSLAPSQEVSVKDAIGDMPRLRSGLSEGVDNEQRWKLAMLEGCHRAIRACEKSTPQVARALNDAITEMRRRPETLARSSQKITKPKHACLRSWLSDPRMAALPNHETRSHMESDLARYAFVAAFADATGRSPKAEEFPKALAPAHDNWTSGKFSDRFRVQSWDKPSTTITSHISKDGHYYIHPDLTQCRSLTVREAARLQTFPDNYFFEGNRSQQYVQVGNAVPPLLARQIAKVVHRLLT
jgi:DNA (cytosine-5)-methyltransferase 1